MSTLSRVIFDPDTTPPSVPTGVAAAAQSTTTIRITWGASTDSGGSGLAGYRVYRATTSGGAYSLISGTLSIASLSFDDTSLSSSTTRYYRVSAVDWNNNESSQGSVVSATTQSAGIGNVTIVGSGFGAKSIVTPYFFQPFTSTVQGAGYVAAGWEFVIANGQGNNAARNFVSMASDGPLPGMGYWRQDVPLFTEAAEWFTHVGKYITGGALGVYTSYWIRIRRIAGTGGGFCQMKGPRAGCSTDTDPVIQYNSAPRYASQFSVSTLSGSNQNRTAPGAEYDSGGGLIQTRNDVDPPQLLTDGNWNQLEVYHRLNTPGSSDGIQVVKLNGFEFHRITNRNIRSSSTQRLRFIQPNPGLANDYGSTGNQWTCDIAGVLIDTIADSELYYAAVWLGNASTRSAVTRKLMLSPLSWSDTQIIASTGGVSIPAAYTHAYVDTATGTGNTVGLSYTVS